MRKYILEAVIDGEIKTFNKEFNSRNQAVRYIFNYYNQHGLSELQINDEYSLNNNEHDREYVSDYDNRFRITRM